MGGLFSGVILNRIIDCCDDVAQFVDNSEVIFVLTMVALLVAMGLLRLRR